MDVIPTKFHFVVLSRGVKHILVSRSNHNISLPTFLQSEDGICKDLPFIGDWRIHTDDVRLAVRTVLGLDTYAVNVLLYRPFRAGEYPVVPAHVILQLELVTNDIALPAGLEWVNCDAPLQWTSFYREVHISALLISLLARMEGPLSQSSSPWRTIGWFTQTESWAMSVIDRHGMNAIGRLSQKTNTSYSTVLSFEVDQIRVNGAPLKHWRTNGSVYVKVTHGKIPEPRLTQSVSMAMRAYVPPLLTIDEERNALIQIGVDAIYDFAPEDVLKALASFHISSIDQIGQLKAGGVPYRGLPWIYSNITNILNHPALDRCENKEVIRSLRGRIDEVQHLCSRLMAYDIPDTLIHGDCHESNIRCGLNPTKGFCLIDWATCSIGFPLFDLFRITFENTWDENLFQPRIDSYYTAWTGFEGQKKMSEAFRLVTPLFFCYNLGVLFTIYETAASTEQPSLLQVVEKRIEGIGKALDEIREDDSSSLDDPIYEPSTYHFVLLSPKEASILVRRLGTQLRLPLLRPPRTEESEWVTSWEKDAAELCRMVDSELGLAVYILRALWVRPDSMYNIEEAVLLAEILDGNCKAAQGLDWVSCQEAAEAEWKVISDNVDVKTLLANLFRGEVSGNVPQNRMPWRSEGWFHDASNWIGEVLSDKHMKLIEPIEVVRNTFLSCVLKFNVRTQSSADEDEIRSDYNLYAKAVHPSLLPAKAVSTVASISPGIVPSVVAVNTRSNMFIQRDAGYDCSPRLQSSILLSNLAELQIHSMDHVDRLKRAGVPLFTTEWLKSVVHEIVNSSMINSCGEQVLREKLRVQIPRLRQCLDELSSFGIPYTLVHGDFHPGNIGKLYNDSAYHIFDWSSAFIGHPFCDFAVLRFSVDEPETDQEEAERTYFGYWRDYGDAEALRRVSQLALILYFCLDLHLLQKFYETTETEDHGRIMDLCKQSAENVLYGLDVRFGQESV